MFTLEFKYEFSILLVGLVPVMLLFLQDLETHKMILEEEKNLLEKLFKTSRVRQWNTHEVFRLEKTLLAVGGWSEFVKTQT